MTPFNGDKVRPRVTARVGGKTFLWLFVKGALATCMTSTSFHTAFPDKKPQKVQNAQDCVATSGNKMNSLGIYKIDLQIKGKTFTHRINVIDQLNNNIIGIDFMQKHKLHYDVQMRQVQISSSKADQIIAIKEQASMVMNVKFKGRMDQNATYMASIHVPLAPMVSRMPAVVSVGTNNNCKIIVNNCAPYDVIRE